MRFISFLVGILIFFASNYSAAVQEARIAAIVNEKSILLSELEGRVKLVIASGGLENTEKVRAQLRQQILKQMIDETLQLLYTEQFKISADEEEIKAAFQTMEERNGMAPGEIDRFLAHHKIPKEILSQQIKASIAWKKYIRERYSSLVQIGQKEIQQELTQKEQEKSQEQALLAEIVLYVDKTNEETVRTQANRLVEQLRRGGNFALLAQQFSQSASAARGGDIGWIPVSQLEKPLADSVKTLETGTITPAIRTPDGYRILLVRQKRAAGSLGEKETVISFQQVLLDLPRFVDSPEMVQDRINQANRLKHSAKSCSILAQLVKGLPSARSKIIKDVSLRELPQPVRLILNRLQVGQVSSPIASEEGIFLFMLCDRQEISPYEPTEEDIHNLLMEKKLSSIAQRELKNLRRGAHVDIRI